jgi:hypothetical protein
MGFFGLDPESQLARSRAAASSIRVPTRGQSVLLGSLGFGLVSLVVYGMWAMGGSWMYTNLGEAGFYGLCALVFVLLTGFILHRLIIGPGAWSRFSGVFALAFTAYAISWCAAWFTLRGKAGEWIGSLAGSIVLGAIIGAAFSAKNAALRVIPFLIVTHAAGYFLGEWLYGFCNSSAGDELLGKVLSSSARAILSKLTWGAAYGLGLGAGLGYAFYASQEEVRARLKALCDAASAA